MTYFVSNPSYLCILRSTQCWYCISCACIAVNIVPVLSVFFFSFEYWGYMYKYLLYVNFEHVCLCVLHRNSVAMLRVVCAYIIWCDICFRTTVVRRAVENFYICVTQPKSVHFPVSFTSVKDLRPFCNLHQHHSISAVLLTYCVLCGSCSRACVFYL